MLVIILLVLLGACSEKEHFPSNSEQAKKKEANNNVVSTSTVVSASSNVATAPTNIAQASSSLAVAVPAEYSEANIAFAQFDAQTTFLINSTFLDDQPAFALGNTQWLLPTKVGPIRLDEKTDALQFTRLIPSDTQYFTIESLAKAKDRFFVGSRRNGIFVLNPQTLSYESNFRIGEVKSFATGGNLEQTQEDDEADIWTSTFQELHKYDQKEAKWDSLNHIFSDLNIGEGSGQHQVFVDPPYVWVHGAAHKNSKGGLFQFDQKSGRWSVYRRELLSTAEEPSRIDSLNLISSPNALWVYLNQGNSYNFYIAYYDKQTNKWQSYHRSEIAPAVERLIEELPNCRWIHKRPILTELLTIVNNPVTQDHPYAFTASEFASLKSTVSKLKNAFDNVDPNTEEARGFARHSVQHGWILKGQAYSSNIPVHKLRFESLTYKGLFASLGARVIVDTDRGLGVLDVSRLRFEPFEPKVQLDQPTSWVMSQDKKIFSLCEYFEGEDGPDVIRTYRFDLQSMKVSMNTASNKKCPSSEQQQPSTLRLSSGIIVDLAWDGLLIRDKESN
jgi:hypothetical protein